MIYDPNKDYFGPEGNFLSKIIPKAPITCYEQLKPGWNYAAYLHDVDYAGKRAGGLFGWYINMRNRRRADNKFLEGLLVANKEAFQSGRINSSQLKDADDYAEIAYLAVRSLGWTFYKTSED